ncbi:putative phosphoric monoester hydrolase [Helianthus annuus]|nr:putative phosphoric monoester hydrolase [Helianthus annuus]
MKDLFYTFLYIYDTCTKLWWYAIGYTVPCTELAFPNEPTPNVPIFRKTRIAYPFSYRVPERTAFHVTIIYSYIADVNIAQYFDDCFGFINEAKRTGSVLVHCFAGRSRSATVVVAYLMKTHGMSSSKALNLVKSKRSVVAPNAGFILQLQSYEKSLPGML